MATGSANGPIRLWDADTGHLARTLPGFSGRVSRTPQPWVLITSVCPASENGLAASRQVTRSGIWARIRVLRRAASADFSVESIVGRWFRELLI